MRIPNSDNLNSSQRAESSNVRSAGQVSGSYTGALSGQSTDGDQVQLSGVSRLLQTGSAQRAQQMAALSKAVRSDSYNIPSGQLSRSLVSETLAQSADR